ncbi:NACHT domain-containing protein [Streptomyces sp. NPDC059011]|uniref:NACHT domain-containing protein n=1 Tax=unclassified Streptomyces TaxID=2593676 RepID=UPI0036B44CDA
MSSSGGRGNEAGSLHRSGFAALLAAYGLRGVPLPFFAADGLTPKVESLQFETEDAVDDIRCTMTGGSYVVFQAKRTCGNDKHLSATVEQWVRQLVDLRSSDRMGLVVRNAKGPVRALREALENYKSDHPRQPTAQMEEALKAVTDRIPKSFSAEETDALLRAAVCVEAATESPGDSYFETAVAFLDGVVVRHGLGAAAVKVLQNSFQRGAASGIGSDVEDWVRWLTEEGLTVESDLISLPGPRIAAENAALLGYSRDWNSRVDVLHYSLLAEDLPELRIENLAHSFKAVPLDTERAKRDKTGLLELCRRWRRLFLLGLPGSGKTTAIRQVAALWAGNPDAPIPLFVSLKRVAEHVQEPTDVTIDLLIEVATAATTSGGKEILRSALLRELRKGNVALFLDGLDECRSLVGVVADGLITTFDSLHTNTAVVLAGRDSALPAAKKLGFPEARLCEPDFLERNMDSLLAAVAKIRIKAEKRREWIEEKRSRVAVSKERNSDIWQVPLLASMLTLLTASTENAPLPKSRAEVLYAVVQDSVRKWELKRISIQPPGGWDSEIKAPHLLDGFAVIGHAINNASSVSGREVTSALEVMLADRWNFSKAKSQSIAMDIRWFWDNHVGVFVSVENGKSTQARSRQFAEIAEAIWVSQQSDDSVRDWLARSIHDTELEETVCLACGLSEDVANSLMEIAQLQSDVGAKGRAFLWLLRAQRDVVSLSDERLKMLMGEVCKLNELDATSEPEYVEQAGEDTRVPTKRIKARRRSRQLEVDGFGWIHVVHAAQISIDPQMRDFRDRAFQSLNLDPHKRDVLNALVALTDATYDNSAPSPEQITMARTLFRKPVAKPMGTTVRTSRRSYKVEGDEAPLLSGHLDAALLAMRFLDVLGDDVLENLKNVAQRAPFSQYYLYSTPLRKAGVDMDSIWKTNLADLSRAFGESDGWNGILEPIMRITVATADSSELSRDDRWRMPDLVSLLAAIGVGTVGAGDYREAINHDKKFLPRWLSAIASVYGMNSLACVQQVSLVLSGDIDDHREGFLFADLGYPAFDSFLVDQDAVETLASTIRSARSDWLAWVSFAVLTSMGASEAVSCLSVVMRTAAAKRRKWATIAWCNSAPDTSEAIQVAFSSEDPAVRAGVASYSRMVNAEGGMLAEFRSSAASDLDGTVRWCATKDEKLSMSASIWSCPDCAHENDMRNIDCTACPTGCRPFGY